MLVSSAIIAKDWSWYWSWILIKISVRDLIRFTRSFFWWEHSTHWSVAVLPIFKVALTRETILTGNHLHGPKWEHTLLVEEDPRLLLVLFPLNYVQERGRPLVRNLGKICFLPKICTQLKEQLWALHFHLDTWIHLRYVHGLATSRWFKLPTCLRFFLPSLGGQQGKKSICLVS